MIPFLPYYNNGHTPEDVAVALIKQGLYDDRTTYRYELDVIQGKQGPTSYKGELLKYMPTHKVLRLKNNS